MKKFDYKKILKVLKMVLYVVITIFVVLFFISVCLQRFSGNRLSFFDYRMFTVVSGSMEPKYNIGDVLISKEIAPEDIKVGDTISYLGKQGTFANKVVTHNVIEIKKDSNGEYYFYTKGLANLIEDPIVHEDQLYGKVVYKTVLLSFVCKIISTNIGLLLFIVIPIIIIIGTELLGAMLRREEERRKLKM